MNNNFVLYLHIAPNGKKYFGITCQRPKQRWKNGHGYKNNEHFWNAIKLYGWSNIKHVVLEIDPSAFLIVTNSREVLGYGFK